MSLIYEIIKKAYQIISPLVVLRLDYIYCIDLTKQLLHWEARVPVTVSAATELDVASAAELQYRETQIDIRRLFESKVKSGHKCFVAKVGSSVVGYNWIGFGSFWNGIDFIFLRETEVWCSDAYTAIEWRGKGIHTALLAAMIKWAGEENYETAYTHVGAFDPRSWKTHERLKWQVSGLYMGVYMKRKETQWSFQVYGSRYPIQRTVFRSPTKSPTLTSGPEQ